MLGIKKILGNLWGLSKFDNFCGDVRILHDFPGEIRKNPTTSTGELKLGRLQMEKRELESSFRREITLWGECLFCWGNQELGLQANLLGIPYFVENSAGDESLEYSGSAGDQEFFRNLTLMGSLKFNSTRDMYFKVLALLRI